MKEGGNRKEQWEQQRTRTEESCLIISAKRKRRQCYMGGFGSGRRLQSKNATIDYRRLDVRRLQREGFLKPGKKFSWKWGTR